MVSHRSARHPLFRQRWFTDDVIDVPESFGNDPFAVWYNVLAA
jgi:hypothetical protein